MTEINRQFAVFVLRVEDFVAAEERQLQIFFVRNIGECDFSERIRMQEREYRFAVFGLRIFDILIMRL